MVKSLDQINPRGCTALGPGIMSCYTLLENQPPGSQIVLCTDGEANQGVGALRDRGCEIFYAGLAQKMQDKGMQVSIITV